MRSPKFLTHYSRDGSGWSWSLADATNNVLAWGWCAGTKRDAQTEARVKAAELRGRERCAGDLTGKSFGRWTVVRLAEVCRKQRFWEVRCSCGTEGRRVSTAELSRGKSQSCGCHHSESVTKHGHTRGSGDYRSSTTYRSWRAMVSRCSNPNSPSFQRYGGRGIAVYPSWVGPAGFETFLSYMGERPDGTSIDRIDGSKGYEPGNVRWADAPTQGRNKSTVKLEPHEPDQIRWLLGQGYRQREVASFFGVSQTAVSKIHLGKRWAS